MTNPTTHGLGSWLRNGAPIPRGTPEECPLVPSGSGQADAPEGERDTRSGSVSSTTAAVCSSEGTRGQLILVSAPESVGVARTYGKEFIDSHMPDASVEFVGDVQLVVSEMVTNAVRYGSEPGDSLLVVLDAGERRVRIEVDDSLRRVPQPMPESADHERGRGLVILGALARWGSDERPTGKVVWAEIPW
ncbi:ATP-binding protein [Streptomyces jumonjinensis]|uniref:ATP-binding protein n=1 Tax=Streptomyces jumonjinensis TaxID=1945 RepID=UPI00379CE08B